MNTGLPYDAEIEYLESTGTQWIDTGVAAGPTTLASARIRLTTTTASRTFLGCQANDNTRLGWYVNASGNWAYQFGDGAANSWSTVTSADTEWHTYNFDVPKRLVEIENVFTNTVASNHSITKTCINNFNLFRMAGSSASSASSQLAWAKLYNGYTIVRDFIPVRVGDVGYMYDRVSRKLFGNSGTDSFDLGPDVQTPVIGMRRMPSESSTRAGTAGLIFVPKGARAYVQDGLIAMWDGIENAGWGVHDASATTWKDLVGDCDGTCTNVTWSNDAAVFNGTSSRVVLASQTPFLSTDLQAEFVIRLATPYQASTVFVTGYNQPCATISASSSIIVTHATNHGRLWPISLTSNGFSIQYASGYSRAAWERGISIDSSNTGSIADSSGVAKIGARYNNGSYGQFMKGDICHLRLYSRALTATEVAANYAIDKIRFNLPST